MSHAQTCAVDMEIVLKVYANVIKVGSDFTLIANGNRTAAQSWVKNRPKPTVHLETLEPLSFLNNSTNTHHRPPKPFVMRF